MKTLDCSQLIGHARAICEGTSGLPPETEEAYRKHWAKTRPAMALPPAKSRGLGDTIAKITKATGLSWFAERAAKIMGLESCGCAERQALLNELFPYKPSEMSDDDWNATIAAAVHHKPDPE
jgi:hypothetical protein